MDSSWSERSLEMIGRLSFSLITGTLIIVVNEERSKSSKLSIASFLIFFGVVIVVIIAVVIGFYSAVVLLQGNSEEGRPAGTFMAIVLLSSPLLHLTGIGLGIAGLVKKEPRGAFAIIGIILNSLAVLVAILFGALAVLGVSV